MDVGSPKAGRTADPQSLGRGEAPPPPGPEIPPGEDWPACPACGKFTVSGVQVRGVYDGVLFWQCIACKHPQHRFPAGHRLHELADPFVQRRLSDPDQPE